MWYKNATNHAFDRRTDRDRILIARPRLHYMQRGKNEKTNFTFRQSFSQSIFCTQRWSQRKTNQHCNVTCRCLILRWTSADSAAASDFLHSAVTLVKLCKSRSTVLTQHRSHHAPHHSTVHSTDPITTPFTQRTPSQHRSHRITEPFTSRTVHITAPFTSHHSTVHITHHVTAPFTSRTTSQHRSHHAPRHSIVHITSHHSTTSQHRSHHAPRHSTVHITSQHCSHHAPHTIWYTTPCVNKRTCAYRLHSIPSVKTRTRTSTIYSQLPVSPHARTRTVYSQLPVSPHTCTRTVYSQLSCHHTHAHAHAPFIVNSPCHHTHAHAPCIVNSRVTTHTHTHTYRL